MLRPSGDEAWKVNSSVEFNLSRTYSLWMQDVRNSRRLFYRLNTVKLLEACSPWPDVSQISNTVKRRDLWNFTGKLNPTKKSLLASSDTDQRHQRRLALVDVRTCFPLSDCLRDEIRIIATMVASVQVHFQQEWDARSLRSNYCNGDRGNQWFMWWMTIDKSESLYYTNLVH